MESNDAPVLIDRLGHITRVTLNRPRAINALTLEMVEIMIQALEHAATDGSRAVVITGAGDRGLCGGGDIKAMAQDGAQHAHEFIEREYVLDLMTQELAIPVIGFMDGITMGGGIGLTGHAAHRIVTETSRLAMPETRIGIVPDVGGHLLLANAPGHLGEYLAVSSGQMDAGDAIALGFADVFVPRDRLPELTTALAEGGEDEASIERIIASFTTAAPESKLSARQREIDELFGEALSAPSFSPAALDLGEWAIAAALRLVALAEERMPEVASTIREMSPTSVIVTLAQITRTRQLGLTLEQVLRDDLRVCSRLFQRDFVEGVRARVIDKDNAPAWNPATLESVEAADIATIINPVE